VAVRTIICVVTGACDAVSDPAIPPANALVGSLAGAGAGGASSGDASALLGSLMATVKVVPSGIDRVSISCIPTSPMTTTPAAPASAYDQRGS
jgi:hypothetical protein